MPLAFTAAPSVTRNSESVMFNDCATMSREPWPLISRYPEGLVADLFMVRKSTLRRAPLTTRAWMAERDWVTAVPPVSTAIKALSPTSIPPDVSLDPDPAISTRLLTPLAPLTRRKLDWSDPPFRTRRLPAG